MHNLLQFSCERIFLSNICISYICKYLCEMIIIILYHKFACTIFSTIKFNVLFRLSWRDSVMHIADLCIVYVPIWYTHKTWKWTIMFSFFIHLPVHYILQKCLHNVYQFLLCCWWYFWRWNRTLQKKERWYTSATMHNILIYIHEITYNFLKILHC